METTTTFCDFCNITLSRQNGRGYLDFQTEKTAIKNYGWKYYKEKNPCSFSTGHPIPPRGRGAKKLIMCDFCIDDTRRGEEKK